MDAKIPGEADDIGGPPDRDRDRADRVFEDEVPADDPRDQFAEGRVGEGIGPAAEGKGGRHLGVAQPGEYTGDRSEQKRKRNGGTSVRSRGVPGQNEDARPYNAADAKGDEVERRQRSL